jgi:hypothetical protein
MKRHHLVAIAALGIAFAATAAKADLVITQPTGLGNFDVNVLFKTQMTDVMSAPGFSNGGTKAQVITFSSTNAINTDASGQAVITPFATTFNNLTLTASGIAGSFTELLLDIKPVAAETVTFTSPTPITSGATQALSANGNNFILITATW